VPGVRDFSDGFRLVRDAAPPSSSPPFALDIGPILLGSQPSNNGTLSKKENNVIMLLFDDTISLPSGPPLTVAAIGGGGDIGDGFAYGTQTTMIPNDTLKVVQQDATLDNRTWYQIRPADDFSVPEFTLDLCVLHGDADGSGQVLAFDYFEVKNNMFEVTDARYDLDGSGQVLAFDYFVVKNHMFDQCPPKP
jgi:hypothetical protein